MKLFIDKKLILLGITLAVSFSRAEIREINSFLPLVAYINEMAAIHNSIIIVWDIDETIFTINGMYGGESWFRHEVMNHVRAGCDTTRAIDLVVPEYYHAQLCADVKPIQEDVAAVISQLQNDGHYVCALTSRGPFIAMRTQEQLESLGIDFFRSCPIPYKESSNCFVWRGVIYGGGVAKKGVLFTDFLAYIEQLEQATMPTLCIFINDKHNYVELVESALQKQYPSIKFCGFWYNNIHHLRASTFCPIQSHKEKQIKTGKIPD